MSGANQRINFVTIVARAGVGCPHWLTTGSGGWLPTYIALQRLFLAGRFTGRAVVGRLRPRMNSLTRLSVGLETQTHVLELLGRRAKDWQKLVAHRRNLACFGWLGAAPESAWSTRRPVA